MKRITDIINGEGAFLALYKKRDTYYLSSFMSNGAGELFYRTTKEDVLAYIDSKITLLELYERSEDTLVFRKMRDEEQYYLKSDMAKYISYGDLYFKDVPSNMCIKNIAGLL